MSEMERPLLADIVAKVENRSAPKIWRKLILGYLRGCVTFQRHWEGPWLILDETIWSPTSARAKCISGSKNFRPSPQKDFCNNIGAKRPFIRKQHPVTDQLESGSGRGRLTVPSGEPRHQCFGGICEHRGVRRSCFHPVRAERRRSVGDQCDVTPSRLSAEYRAISQTRPDVGRGGIRTIVSIAMRRAGNRLFDQSQESAVACPRNQFHIPDLKAALVERP